MTASEPEALSLKETAERLGVHYMTAYRYVRTGILPATKQGSEWRVALSDLEAFRSGSDTGEGGRARVPWKARLRARMIAGDERGSWLVVEAALASGLTPERIYLDVLGPALREIGDGWEEGSVTVGEEHRASAVASRIIGRLGGRFAARGRPKGRVVLGSPPGERHSIPSAMVADMLRSAGFEPVDLGGDTPIESFLEAVEETGPLAVGISVSSTDALDAAAAVVAAVREGPGLPVVIGGRAVRDASHAAELGADAYAADGRGAVEFVLGLLE